MLNQITIIGRIGQDIDLRQTKAGTPVAQLSVATSRKWTNKQTGELQEETQWHKVNVWRGQAEYASNYIQKGDLVSVVGEMTYRAFQDKDGNNRTNAEITAQSIQRLNKREAGQAKAATSTPTATPATATAATPAADDDLPF